MDNKALELGQEAIKRLNNKDFGIYFFTIDTKGNPTAGVANIYEHVKVLTEMGYKAYILHETAEYHGVADWLGQEYMDLPHVSIESQELNVSPSDFVIIPEVFSNVMDQTKQFPCKRLVFCQSYDYILELITVGSTWGQYGIEDVITISPKISEYVKTLFPSMRTYEIPVGIPDYFEPAKKPKKPIVAIHTRDQKDALKIVKSFYLQFPMYKWVTFKEIRGISREAAADALGEACLSVWVDDIASFGTYPLESIHCNTPVIGKIPNLIPDWLALEQDDKSITVKNNGIWTSNLLQIPDLISQFLKLWLEDSIPAELIQGIEDSKGEYTEDAMKEKIKEVYEHIIAARIAEIEGKLETINNMNENTENDEGKE